MRDSHPSEPQTRQIELATLGESYSRLNRSGKARQKQWTPKVKTGCVTCRIRRVKCDEAKPRSALQYGPYISQAQVLFHRTKMRRLQLCSPKANVQGSRSSADALPLGSVTTPNLAGFFDKGRWTRRLLQMSHQYPALWHAMTAVACTHRDFMTDRTPITVSRLQDNDEVRFALRQWNKSIQSLQELLSGQVLTKLDRLVVLSICLLFTTLASLQGRQRQAFVHINSGLKLLHQWNLADIARCQSDEDLDLHMLFILFSQLDSQARPYHLDILQRTDKQLILASRQSHFQSLLEACVALEVHFNNMMHLFSDASLYTHGPNAKAQTQKQKCINDFIEWDNQLAPLLSPTPHPEDKKALTLLQIRRALAHVALTMDLSKGELAHDDFTQDYASILHLVSEILELPTRQTQDPTRSPKLNFSLATITTEPLFLVAFRCREPTIRKQAMHLLRQYPGREGICEGMASLKIVERVVEIEEECLTSAEGACADGQWICGNHRVTLLQFFLVHERQVKTVMHTGEDLLLGRSGRELVTTYW
ncbi:dynamin GTPase [Aspergillus sclerotiicarbonarius CBS 121057]|uniref:Dynamin GTPase n=1 Tax=Aspergillus sclerotiicarbonarius (strain CBS 121057 / IBT 28362) TaxID=1448318 RepID=A0A319EKL2_ASPSB|nr:dynamin GTPase [Aspergillus sclerotiicarbonarius CBS 121057]